MTEKKYTAGLKSWTNARRWAAVWTRSRNNTHEEDDRSRAYRNVATDKGTFNELDKLVNHRKIQLRHGEEAADCRRWYGHRLRKIDGRPVFVYAYDFTCTAVR